MAYQLKERAPNSLAEMQNVAVTLEANLIAKRNRAITERKTKFKEEPLAIDQKLDALINGMHRLVDRVDKIERKSSWDRQQNNEVRNQNFRKNQNINAARSILTMKQDLLSKKITQRYPLPMILWKTLT